MNMIQYLKGKTGNNLDLKYELLKISFGFGIYQADGFSVRKTSIKQRKEWVTCLLKLQKKLTSDFNLR